MAVPFFCEVFKRLFKLKSFFHGKNPVALVNPNSGIVVKVFRNQILKMNIHSNKVKNYFERKKYFSLGIILLFFQNSRSIFLNFNNFRMFLGIIKKILRLFSFEDFKLKKFYASCPSLFK